MFLSWPTLSTYKHHIARHCSRVVSRFPLGRQWLRPAGDDHTPACCSSANPYPMERSVRAALEFAVQSTQVLLGWLPGREHYLPQKTVLEIGPGQDFGMPLILMGFGARVVLVDRYLHAWEPAFHPLYYRSLRQTAVQAFPQIDTTAIDAVIAKGAHVAQGLTTLQVGLEEIAELPTGSVDITYSNATLEHLADVSGAIQQLARVTTLGGVGFHQIDFRDHSDFSRPLEYLTKTAEELQALLQKSSCTCGNALRYTEFEALFQAAGFQTRLEVNMLAEDDYLHDILARMHARFRNLPIDAFRVLGGRFFLAKTRHGAPPVVC